MSSQSFSSYLSKAASHNSFTTDVSWLSTFFPAFDITPISAQKSGANLVIKGQLNITNNDLPFGSKITGFSALTSFLPTFSVTQDFTLTIMPATGKDQNQITASMVLPIVGNYSITIPNSPKKTPSLSDVSVTITVVDSDPPTASFGIGGTMDMTLYQNQSVSVKAGASFTVSNDEVTAIQIDVLDTFSEPLKSPEVLGNRLTLDNIGVSVGVNFEPPGCLVGIEGSGTITTPNNTIQIEKAAIVCDVEGDVPIPLYLGLTANQLNLSDFMGIVGQEFPVPDIPVTFNNPSMYYCKQGVTLPDGTVVAKGFSVSSECDILGFNFYGSCAYAEGQSVSADFQTDGPLDILGVFTLSSSTTTAKGITKKAGVNNLSLPTNQQEWQAWQKSTGGTVAYKPGGAYFSLNMSRTNSNPSFAADLAVEFLGETVASLDASVQKDGINMSFQIPAFYFNGSFKATHTGITGSFTSQIGNDIPIPFDNNTESLGFLTSNYGFTASLYPESGPSSGSAVNASMTIDGQEITLATGLPFDFNSYLGMLEGLVVSNQISITQAFQNNQTMWIAAVGNFVVFPDASVTDKAKFAIEGLGKWGTDPGFTQPGAGAWQNPFPKAMSSMQHALGYNSSHIANALHSQSVNNPPFIPIEAVKTGKILTNVAQYIPTVAGFAAADIAAALHLSGVFNASINDMATVFKYAETPIKDAAKAIENIFPGEEKAIGEALKGAGYLASDVWNDFKELGGDFLTAAETVANEAKKIAGYFDPANW